MDKKTIIELDQESAELFVWFLKYLHIWKKARKELRPGGLMLHFDNNGSIRKKEFHYTEPEICRAVHNSLVDPLS